MVRAEVLLAVGRLVVDGRWRSECCMCEVFVAGRDFRCLEIVGRGEKVVEEIIR